MMFLSEIGKPDVGRVRNDVLRRKVGEERARKIDIFPMPNLKNCWFQCGYKRLNIQPARSAPIVETTQEVLQRWHTYSKHTAAMPALLAVREGSWNRWNAIYLEERRDLSFYAALPSTTQFREIFLKSRPGKLLLRSVSLIRENCGMNLFPPTLLGVVGDWYRFAIIIIITIIPTVSSYIVYGQQHSYYGRQVWWRGICNKQTAGGFKFTVIAASTTSNKIHDFLPPTFSSARIIATQSAATHHFTLLLASVWLQCDRNMSVHPSF